jgi:hypothetical protein
MGMTKNESMVKMAQMVAKSNETSKVLAGKNEKLEKENVSIEKLRECFQNFLKKVVEG